MGAFKTEQEAEALAKELGQRIAQYPETYTDRPTTSVEPHKTVMRSTIEEPPTGSYMDEDY